MVAHRMADPSKFIVKEGSARDNDSSNGTTTTHTAVSLQLDDGPGQYAVAVFKMASDRTITGKPLLVEVVEVQPFTVVPLPSTTSGNILICSDTANVALPSPLSLNGLQWNIAIVGQNISPD